MMRGKKECGLESRPYLVIYKVAVVGKPLMLF
jgi:hypothetical protein